MLVLTRKIDESIQIGPGITITVVRIGPGSVRIGIEANRDVTILRSELVESSTQEEVRNEDRGVSVE